MGPGAVLLPAVRFAALPHTGRSRVDSDRVVHNPARNRVDMALVARPRAPCLLLEQAAEDGQSRTLASSGR